MKKPEEIAKALHLCYNPPSSCDDCPYDDCKDCVATAAKDAEECIRALVDKIPRWIPVEDRLPEGGKNVLIFVRTMSRRWHIEVDWRDGNSWYNNAETDWNKITHWMPLPEPPEEE